MNTYFLIISFFAASGASQSYRADYPTLEACQKSAEVNTAAIKEAGGKLVYSLCAPISKAWPGKS